VLWVESHRAVVAGDTVADFGDGLEVSARWLREGVTRESEEQRALRDALARLTPEQRVLIEEAFFMGYTQSELAARFKLPLGTVKTRIRTGMLAMREHLQHLV